MGLLVNYIYGALLLAIVGNHGNAFLLQRASPLYLWNRQIEVGAKTLRVSAGGRLSITCDGSLAGSRSDPQLAWYGPDRHIIAYEGRHNRVSIERALSPRFLKLRFRRLQYSHSGIYICAGLFDNAPGVQYRYFNLIVGQGQATPPPTTVQTTTATTSTTLQTTTTTSTTVQTTAAQTTPGSQTTRGQQTTTQEADNIIQTTTAPDNCTASRFRCGSGECFELRFRCDRFPDCSDASDERGCNDGSPCLEGMFACTTGTPTCVPSNEVCNTVENCADGSDEAESVCAGES